MSGNEMKWQRPKVIPGVGLNSVQRNYQHIEVKPYAGACGAEIFGVDISRPVSTEAIDEIKCAFLDHLVIFFRDQTVEPESLKNFGKHFGSFHIHPYVGSLEGHPEIMMVVKNPEDKYNFSGTWHSDVTFDEKPPLGSILCGMEVPKFGGNTLFANQYLAYDMLSETYKELLKNLKGVHSAENVYGRAGEYSSEDYRSKHAGTPIRGDETAQARVSHPIIRTHPETGRKALYVNEPFTVGIEGLSEEESEPILRYLVKHAVQPDICCNFRWEPGSIAFWDNRCLQHYALNDYPGERRVMWRLTINGDRPF